MLRRLNNKGWGLSTFLGFIVVFFFMILLITYIANKNGIGSSGTEYEEEEEDYIILN